MTQNMVYMTQQIAKGFELMASQTGSKGIIGDIGSSQSAERRQWLSTFSHEHEIRIDPMNFSTHDGLLHLNLLFPKKRLTFNLKLIQ